MTDCLQRLDISTCKVDSLEALNTVRSPDCTLALWERAPVPSIDAELRQLPATAFPGVRQRIHPGKAREALAALIRLQGYDAEADFPAWLDDMTRLSEAFFALSDGQRVTARLETLDRTVCPRFHVDQSYLRLICTYRGPGTEWLDEAQVDRAAQTGGAPNQAIVRAGRPNRMPAYAVGLMKGSRYRGHTDGLVHRSPAHGHGDPVRVLFCLDCH